MPKQHNVTARYQTQDFKSNQKGKDHQWRQDSQIVGFLMATTSPKDGKIMHSKFWEKLRSCTKQNWNKDMFRWKTEFIINRPLLKKLQKDNPQEEKWFQKVIWNRRTTEQIKWYVNQKCLYKIVNKCKTQ